MVDSITYYKDIFLFNRGSLCVGQRVILLCDNDNVENVVVQNGHEDEALKRLIFRLIWLIIWLIIDFIGTCSDWKDVFDEYNNVGIIGAAVLIFIMIFEKITERFDSDKQ